MAMITISRQLGSLGTEIARGVAEELKYEYADKEMVGKIMAGYGITAPEMDKFDEKNLLYGVLFLFRGETFFILFKWPSMI